MRIRSTEVKVAQHLTLDSLTVLLAEAQERFLYSKGIKEIIATHQSLLVDHICLSFTERVQAREELLFEVGVFMAGFITQPALATSDDSAP